MAAALGTLMPSEDASKCPNHIYLFRPNERVSPVGMIQ